MKRILRLGTLFTGIDAVGAGASRVYNVKHIFACEKDKFARKSFLENNKIDLKHFHKDVSKMDGAEYVNNVDVLAGGPPCQSFSLAGLRKGIIDERGGLIYDFVRIVKKVKAPIIIFENVKGIQSIDKGKTIREFISSLREIGYHCHFDILNSKDYGVPQNRERFFLVGFLDSKMYHSFSFKDKTPLTLKLHDILEKDVPMKYFLSEKIISGFIKHKERHRLKGNGYGFTPLTESDTLARTITNPSKNYQSDNYIKVYAHLTSKGRDQNNRIYDTSGISPTLTTMQGGGQTPKVFYPTKSTIRKLTPRECLRLQGFHDSFNIAVSDSQIYKQAGNSMTATVLEMIFNQIKMIEDGTNNRKTLMDFLC